MSSMKNKRDIEQISTHKPVSRSKALRKLSNKILDIDGRAALITLLIRIFGAGIGFLSHIFFARIMGTAEYGLFVYAWVWVVVLGSLSQMGTSTSATRFVAQYLEKGRNWRVFAFMRFAALLSLFSGLASGIGLALFAFFIQGTPSLSSDFYALLIAALCLPWFALAETGKGMARGFGWSIMAYSPVFIERPVLTILITISIFIVGVNINALMVLIASLIALMITTSFQWYRITRSAWRYQSQLRKTIHTKHWLEVSFPLLIVEAYFLVITNTDIIVLKLFEPASQIAIYFAAVKVAALVSFFQTAASSAAARPIAKAYAKSDMEAIKVLSRKFTLMCFIPTLLSFFILLIAGEYILWLFGPEFVEGYPLLLLLICGLLVQSSIGPVRYALSMTGHQKTMAWLMLFTAATNIILNFVFIPIYGPYGAAIATLISTLGFSMVMVILVHKYLGYWSFILPFGMEEKDKKN